MFLVQWQLNTVKIWLALCLVGCVRFARHCAKMYSRHLFSYSGLFVSDIFLSFNFSCNITALHNVHTGKYKWDPDSTYLSSVFPLYYNFSNFENLFSLFIYTRSQVASLQETNRILNKEKEEKEKQLQLMKMREETLTKLVRVYSLSWRLSAYSDLTTQFLHVFLLDGNLCCHSCAQDNQWSVEQLSPCSPSIFALVSN